VCKWRVAATGRAVYGDGETVRWPNFEAAVELSRLDAASL
jgi:hypothetical protein